MEIIINPKNYSDEYIENLNKCFENWGNRDKYDWVFNRSVGCKTSDFIVIKNEKNEAIAGSGITYRKIKGEKEKEISIGIMTGSWTLPNARGRGCFSKIIEVSKQICKKNDIPYLTAFVVESNPSYRRLKDAGSTLIPTSHFISNDKVNSSNLHVEEIAIDSVNEDKIYKKFKESNYENLGFNYTKVEFISQYINRTNKINVLKINNDFAIIEETENIIKLLFITYDNLDSFIKNTIALVHWGRRAKAKDILLYSTKKDIVDELKKLGFEYLPSYFTVLGSTENHTLDPDLFGKININAGDKM